MGDGDGWESVKHGDDRRKAQLVRRVCLRGVRAKERGEGSSKRTECSSPEEEKVARRRAVMLSGSQLKRRSSASCRSCRWSLAGRWRSRVCCTGSVPGEERQSGPRRDSWTPVRRAQDLTVDGFEDGTVSSLDRGDLWRCARWRKSRTSRGEVHCGGKNIQMARISAGRAQ